MSSSHHSNGGRGTRLALLALLAAILMTQPATAQSTPGDGSSEPLHLGVVLYPGWEPLDVFGPLEMFMNVGANRLRIHMLAEEAGPVPSSAGAYPESLAPKVIAETSLADAPKLDIILVPGGFGTLKALQSEPLLDWLRERSDEASYVTSVCSGSAILGKAGLLDGKEATGTKQLFAFVAAQGPKTEWQEEARWVEDGKFITSSGVSAGIDMSLALISKLFGEETAVGIANATEYEWHRDPDTDPFSKYLNAAMGALAPTEE